MKSSGDIQLVSSSCYCLSVSKFFCLYQRLINDENLMCKCDSVSAVWTQRHARGFLNCVKLGQNMASFKMFLKTFIFLPDCICIILTLPVRASHDTVGLQSLQCERNLTACTRTRASYHSPSMMSSVSSALQFN